MFENENEKKIIEQKMDSTPISFDENVILF